MEKFALAPTLSALQVFSMVNPQVPIDKIRFLSIQENPNMKESFYGDVVACSSKLMRFIPHKKNKEFTPANCCVYVEYNAMLLTAVATSIICYDISTGHLLKIVKRLWSADLTAFFFEGDRYRSLYIGCADGSVIAYCFRSDTIIDSILVAEKEVSCLAVYRGARTFITIGSLDGSLRLVEEARSKLTISPYAVTNAFKREPGAPAVAIAQVCASVPTDPVIAPLI